MATTSKDKYKVLLNYEGEDIEIIVDDLATASLILNDNDAAYNVLHQANPEKYPLQVQKSAVEISETCSFEPTPSTSASTSREMIWTKKKPTAHDREATSLLLSLRQKYHKQFDDKKNCKAQLWNKISQHLTEQNFNVGDNGPERCRQKFANITKTYLAYVKHQKRTGEAKNENTPPFFDEIHSILGSRHKVNPNYLEDTFGEIEENEGCNNHEVNNNETEESYDTEASSSSTSRFKNVKKRIKPISRSEKVLEELKADRESREKQFQFVQQRLNRAEEQRDKLLDILECAFTKNNRSKKRDHSDSE